MFVWVCMCTCVYVWEGCSLMWMSTGVCHGMYLEVRGYSFGFWFFPSTLCEIESLFSVTRLHTPGQQAHGLLGFHCPCLHLTTWVLGLQMCTAVLDFTGILEFKLRFSWYLENAGFFFFLTELSPWSRERWNTTLGPTWLCQCSFVQYAGAPMYAYQQVALLKQFNSWCLNSREALELGRKGRP